MKAEAWQADLDAGRVKNRAALARREGTSTVRVTQILRLLELEPSIRAWIRSLPPGTPARYLAERQLRSIATEAPSTQITKVRERWGCVWARLSVIRAVTSHRRRADVFLA